MHLRHQALILGLTLLPLTGCARLLQSILAPQQAALNTAQSVANSAATQAQAPAKQLDALNSEVGRLLGGDGADKAELARLQEALDKRMEQIGSGTSAQSDPERLQPWHPRIPPPVSGKRERPSDEFALGRRSTIRALPAPGLVADGIAAAELPEPIDLTPMRANQKGRATTR